MLTLLLTQIVVLITGSVLTKCVVHNLQVQQFSNIKLHQVLTTSLNEHHQQSIHLITNIKSDSNCINFCIPQYRLACLI